MSTWFKIFLLLHFVSIVVAFAPSAIAVLPGGRAGSVTAAIGRVVYAPALILAGLFGILCVVTSDDVFAFDQTWVTLAFIVWIAMNGVFHAMVLPARSRWRFGRGTRAVDVDTGHAVITVLFVIMLYLMIWKPGL